MAKTKTAITVISKISERKGSQQAALVVIYGAALGRKYDLVQSKMTLGRSSSADIQVDEESVSRNHAELKTKGDEVYIADLKSTNGTFVNDEPVDEKYRLRNGDFLKIGRTIFKFIESGNIESAYHDEIYRMTTVDGLTQISNRRFFTESLEREISRCRRYAHPLCLVMMDIDLFKKVNDTHGHLAGDQVLKHVANVLRRQVRREDTLARYGGEEFGLLLPELGLQDAGRVAEKLRLLVASSQTRWEEHSLTVTLSSGVAALKEGELAEDFVKRSDEKLYQAKAQGRNRVVT